MGRRGALERTERIESSALAYRKKAGVGVRLIGNLAEIIDGAALSAGP